MKLIAGKLQNDDKVRFWSWDYEYEPRCGNYAVVENLNDYTLVRIVGVVETDAPKELTRRKLKKAVLSVPKFLLSGEYESKPQERFYEQQLENRKREADEFAKAVKHLTECEVKAMQYHTPTISYMEMEQLLGEE